MQKKYLQMKRHLQIIVLKRVLFKGKLLFLHFIIFQHLHFISLTTRNKQKLGW